MKFEVLRLICKSCGLNYNIEVKDWGLKQEFTGDEAWRNWFLLKCPMCFSESIHGIEFADPSYGEKILMNYKQ